MVEICRGESWNHLHGANEEDAEDTGSMLASMMDERRGSIAQAKFDLDVQELSPLLITPGHLQVYGNNSEGPVLLQLSPLCSVFFFFFSL